MCTGQLFLTYAEHIFLPNEPFYRPLCMRVSLYIYIYMSETKSHRVWTDSSNTNVTRLFKGGEYFRCIPPTRRAHLSLILELISWPDYHQIS